VANTTLDFHGWELIAGADLIPGDMPISLGSLRQWAADNDAIFDVEAQLLGDERQAELAKVFSSDDALRIAITISQKPGASPLYLERALVPVKTLARLGEQVQVVDWRIERNPWHREGQATQPNMVRFGFWYPGISDELCSVSTARGVVQEFENLLEGLANSYDVLDLERGGREINVDGAVTAEFFKEGRSYGVHLSARSAGSQLARGFGAGPES
jgi:hypothetical protein